MGETRNTLPYGTGDNRRQMGTMPLKGAVGARPPGGFQQPSWGNSGSGSGGLPNTGGPKGPPSFSGAIPEDVRRRIQQAVAGRQQGVPASGGGGPSGMPGYGPGGLDDIGGDTIQPYRPQPRGGTGPKDSGDPRARTSAPPQGAPVSGMPGYGPGGLNDIGGGTGQPYRPQPGGTPSGWVSV